MTAAGPLAAEAAGDYGEAVTYALVPTAPPINPADIDWSETAVEIVLMWGETQHPARRAPVAAPLVLRR